MKSVRSAFIAGALIACAAVAHAQDVSKVQIKANNVTDKFYTLDGQGGTTGILVGPDGVFMVDTQFALLSDKIAAAIKQITPQPMWRSWSCGKGSSTSSETAGSFRARQFSPASTSRRDNW